MVHQQSHRPWWREQHGDWNDSKNIGNTNPGKPCFFFGTFRTDFFWGIGPILPIWDSCGFESYGDRIDSDGWFTMIPRSMSADVGLLVHPALCADSLRPWLLGPRKLGWILRRLSYMILYQWEYPKGHQFFLKTKWILYIYIVQLCFFRQPQVRHPQIRSNNIVMFGYQKIVKLGIFWGLTHSRLPTKRLSLHW